MNNETRIVFLVAIVGLLIFLILALIYILPIIFIKRFHTVTHILTGNVCLTSILCSFYGLVCYIILVFYPNTFNASTLFCSLTPYLQTMFNCLIIYALAMITINRFFIVIYPQKQFFKQQTWSFISLGIQWLLAIILPLPNLKVLSQMNVCLDYTSISLWLRLYNLFIIVILPSFINGIFNLGIFFSVRSSTRRVHTLRTITCSNHQNARDVYLLKHMLFIFIIFVGGWIPVYILSVINPYQTTFYLGYLILQILPEISTIIVMLDLFWYSRDLRDYLKIKLLKCLQLNKNRGH